MKRVRPYPHFKFPDEIVIEYFQLDDNSCKWHNVPAGSYEIRCANYGWFPTDILMGTDSKGKYADTNKIGATIGGNLGTMGIAVLNIEKALEMLATAGYPTIQPAKKISFI